ncbi:MAG: hypothetical protein A3K19_17400 [Lentisphaerae bacterium RIFOXYB12_FULL_65_16]|nr:MAG: hypothetical protein A3K18_09040 [Lentisphaerae bacterium RIFOXYA12_64_32]OGV85641.1 MAG: hypothetical protein A3K19_17400 [Lentisphaerae bacterium RIFOXYB12_FULL_65_16]
MPVPNAENIVRAVTTEKYDGERISPSLFEGRDASVSRLAVVPLEDQWELLRRHVEKPPQRLLALLGEINVGTLARIGLNYAPQPTVLTVEAAPLPEFPSHGVIPQKITRGLATQIVRNLTRHAGPTA